MSLLPFGSAPANTTKIRQNNFFRSLKWQPKITAMASPPTLSLISSSGITTPQSIAATSSKLTWRYTANIVSKGSGYYTGGHISQTTPGASGMAYAAAIGFITDAPIIEVKFLSQAVGEDYAVWVDGEPVSLDYGPRDLPYQAVRYLKIDFGAGSTKRYLNSATVASGGTGYALGDEITLAGGTGTPTVLVVVRESGGVIISVGVKSPGNYSSLPSTPASQASTTGGGTGATFTISTTGFPINATRKFRRIEVYLSRLAWCSGINIGPQDTCIAMPHRADPLVMVCGDSFTGGFFTYDSSLAYGQQMCRYLGLDNYMISPLAGTGYLATSGGSVKVRDRMNTDFVPYNPKLFIMGPFGYNDYAQDPTALQAEVETFWQQMGASLPNTYFISLGVNVGSSAGTPDSTRKAAIAAGFAAGAPAGRSYYYDGFAEGWQTGTGSTGNAGFYISPDSIHPPQQGHDALAIQCTKAVLYSIGNIVN